MEQNMMMRCNKSLQWQNNRRLACSAQQQHIYMKNTSNISYLMRMLKCFTKDQREKDGGDLAEFHLGDVVEAVMVVDGGGGVHMCQSSIMLDLKQIQWFVIGDHREKDGDKLVCYTKALRKQWWWQQTMVVTFFQWWRFAVDFFTPDVRPMRPIEVDDGFEAKSHS